MWGKVLEELRVIIRSTEGRPLTDAELDRAALLIAEVVLLAPPSEDVVRQFHEALPADGVNRIGRQLEEWRNARRSAVGGDEAR